jgi:hypothetical protein
MLPQPSRQAFDAALHEFTQKRPTGTTVDGMAIIMPTSETILWSVNYRVDIASEFPSANPSNCGSAKAIFQQQCPPNAHVKTCTAITIRLQQEFLDKWQVTYQVNMRAQAEFDLKKIIKYQNAKIDQLSKQMSVVTKTLELAMVKIDNIKKPETHKQKQKTISKLQLKLTDSDPKPQTNIEKVNTKKQKKNNKQNAKQFNSEIKSLNDIIEVSLEPTNIQKLVKHREDKITQWINHETQEQVNNSIYKDIQKPIYFGNKMTPQEAFARAMESKRIKQLYEMTNWHEKEMDKRQLIKGKIKTAKLSTEPLIFYNG